MQWESDICGNCKPASDDDDERAVREEPRRRPVVAVGTRPSDSAGKKKRRRRRGPPPSPAAAGSPVEKPSAADGGGDGDGGTAATTTTSARTGPATSPDDPRVAEAVRLWRKAPALSVIQAMRAVCFTEEDCQSRGKQMWIRRRAPHAREMRRTAANASKGMRTAPPLVRTAAGSPPQQQPPRKKRKAPVPSEGGRTKNNAPAAAPPSAAGGAKKKSPAPAAPLRRATTKAAQENRVHRRSLAAYKAMVHRKATELYASERRKGDGVGMSARRVREHLSLEYDHVPSARTIQRYFQTDLVGAAPLRHGPGGTVPRDVFERLCVAFRTKIRINQLNGDESENSRGKLAGIVDACVNREGSGASETLLRRILAETAEGILADTGASGKQGGRPAAVFYDPDLPRAGQRRRDGGPPPPDLGAVAASLERDNDAATRFLTERGYRGELMRARVFQHC